MWTTTIIITILIKITITRDIHEKIVVGSNCMSTPDLFLYSSNNTGLTFFLNVQFNSLKPKRERERESERIV
jgi:hypothetical protein